MPGGEVRAYVTRVQEKFFDFGGEYNTSNLFGVAVVLLKTLLKGEL
jgi:hypothetical protein